MDPAWWTNAADLSTPDRFVSIGSARVHPRTAPLVDASVDRYEPLYRQLWTAIDAACAGSDRRPWAAVGPCGSGIRTAFQTDPPDLDAKVPIFFAPRPGESIEQATGALAAELTPKLLAALQQSPSLNFHCMHVPWMRPTAEQLAASSFPDGIPWQSKHMWFRGDIDRGALNTPEGAIDLREGFDASRLWSLVLAITEVGDLPASMDVELLPIAVTPDDRQAHDLLSGYKVSTLGRAFFRERDAFAYRALERRALAVHGRKPVSNHAAELTANARVMHLGGRTLKAIKLLIEPTAATGDTALLGALQHLVQSPLWRLRNTMQCWRALHAFVHAATAPRDWAVERLNASIASLERAPQEPNGDADLRGRARDIARSGSPQAVFDALGSERSMTLQTEVSERMELRARETLREHPQLLGRWFGFEPG